MEAISFLYVNMPGVKFYQFKAKYSEIVTYPLHLDNISRDNNDNMK